MGWVNTTNKVLQVKTDYTATITATIDHRTRQRVVVIAIGFNTA